jgi:hypothetical protein
MRGRGSRSELSSYLIVGMQGGIGNRLFQYAAALTVAERLDVAVRYVEVPTRTGSLSLSEFLDPPIAAPTRRQRALLLEPLGLSPALGALFAATRRVPGLSTLSAGHRLVQSHLPEAAYEGGQRVGALQTPALMWGYFQHPDFFEATIDRVVDQILAVMPKVVRDHPLDPSTLVLGIRRGDFVSLGLSLPFSYYESALEVLGAGPGSSVRVLGDDREFNHLVEALLLERGYRVLPAAYPELSPLLADFWTMATSRDTIIPDSTFAWWANIVGDHLSPDTERKVVCPPANQTGYHHEYLVWPGWHQLASVDSDKWDH